MLSSVYMTKPKTKKIIIPVVWEADIDEDEDRYEDEDSDDPFLASLPF